MEPLMFVRVSFWEPSDKPKVNYRASSSQGLLIGPFSYPLTVTTKTKQGKTINTQINANCGVLSTGLFFAEAQPPNTKGICTGCIQEALIKAQGDLWHFIQEKAQHTLKTALT